MSHHIFPDVVVSFPCTIGNQSNHNLNRGGGGERETKQTKFTIQRKEGTRRTGNEAPLLSFFLKKGRGTRKTQNSSKLPLVVIHVAVRFSLTPQRGGGDVATKADVTSPAAIAQPDPS